MDMLPETAGPLCGPLRRSHTDFAQAAKNRQVKGSDESDGVTKVTRAEMASDPAFRDFRGPRHFRDLYPRIPDPQCTNDASEHHSRHGTPLFNAAFGRGT